MRLNSLLVKVSAVIAAFTLLMILSVGSTFIVARSQESDAQVIDLAAQQRLLINKIKAASQQLVAALESESDSEEFHQELHQLATLFDTNLILLVEGGTLPNPAEQAVIPQPSRRTYEKLMSIRGLWVPYKTYLDVLMMPNVDIVSDSFYDATIAIVDAFEPLAQTIAEVVPELKAESTEKSEDLKRVLLASLLITLAVALLSWFYVQRWIIRPISELALGIRTLSTESDLTQHVAVRSKDEIGQVAGNFNRMASEFRAIIGDFSNTTDRIDKETDNLSAIAGQTKNDVEHQHARLESVATAITELAASAHSVIDSTAAAVAVTSQTAATAEQGQDEAKVSASVLDTMVESVRNTGIQMEKLQKNAQDIGAIVDVIRGIAEQTNLLALNAAIEAARAGENGRGFAVVADEVRSLAQRTQQSTIEIQEMIAKLQSNTEKASIHIQDGQIKAEDSASHMAKLSQSLLSMAHSVNQINELNTTIAAAAKEQGSVTDEISEKITAVSDGIGQSSHYAENTAQAGRVLSGLSGELRQRMLQFKT